MEISDQKILVTGATGFIGGHITRRLLGRERAAVRMLVRDSRKAEGLIKLGAEAVEGDLGDMASLERAVNGTAAVIHAAAQVSSIPKRETFVQANRRGTENLLWAAARAQVPRVVHLSSVAVFGIPADGEVTDRSPRAMSGDPYGDSKYDAEVAVERYSRERGLPVTILRPSAVYGPGSTHWSVIPLKRIKKGKFFLVEEGQGLLNYVYIDNLVDAVVLALQTDASAGEAFIVNDGAVTACEFFLAYARMAGISRKLPSVSLLGAKIWARYRNLIAAVRRESSRVPAESLGFLTARAVYRQTHIEETLGYHQRIDLREGMRRTETWFHETGLL
jgi:nucleoside-diphosphate-sugar epimerase